ncbi:transcriptional regulator [Parazoarcus communis]|uniref:OmpR/PhoB-type domain-containing protein n=1 Tax=Parazoarcus communis SWub3 = DSM 12120 TaxID=1121029 RepID=A0A323UYF0_9RHOO|nr:transcriptional regulator [Parazoarcus communis]NMG69077.1 hypothetical protein [Parazoarcus communis SWub3 = DSM 12120]PZA16933.1 hypothetical protein DNK49_09830 [Azoarcus communis] [Parazoarcus communis SWub3 = DSM 12120]
MDAALDALPAHDPSSDDKIIRIRFGPAGKCFAFDPALYRLTQGQGEDSKSIDLGYAGSRLLQRLLECPGEVVSREDLMEYAWPGRVVGQGSLNQQIYALRQVLGDESGREVIQTVPRRGYQFNARFLEQQATSAPNPTPAPMPQPPLSTLTSPHPAILQRRVLPAWMWPGAFISLACALAASLFILQSPSPAPTPSIAFEHGRIEVIVDVRDTPELEAGARHIRQLVERLSTSAGDGVRITFGRRDNYFELYCERAHQPVSWLLLHRSQLDGLSEDHLRKCLS